MASNQEHISALSRGLSLSEDWENLISWDDEIYDPLFQGDIFTGTNHDDSFTSSYHISESIPSAAASVADGPASFDYAVSAPPSIIEGCSSVGQNNSWLSTSPSFSTAATSSPIEQTERAYPGSFNEYDYTLSPVTETPILDTRQCRLPHSFNYSNSYRIASPFNPYIPSSPHAFSGLDVSASFALTSNVRTWADQLQAEPIPEHDHVRAIPIPHIDIPGANNNFSPDSPSWGVENSSQEKQPARAITIPQPNRRSDGHNNGTTLLQWSQNARSTLSVSPESRRRPRSTTLSRSASRNESRHSATRHNPTTLCPTSSSFGWVAYRPNVETNRLVPVGAEGRWGRRQRGRTRALNPEQRRNAAIMRVVGSCNNCKKRKEKCDPGIPCKSCLEHYKADLIHFPCRDRLLSDLSKVFLSDRLGWHPTTRALESFISPPNSFDIVNNRTYMIPLSFGFHPVLYLPVHAVQLKKSSALCHDHIVYLWPPGNSLGEAHRNAVLPAVLTPEALSKLSETLDAHLSMLVMQHFHSFPLYRSPLRILRDIYIFYRLLPTNTSSSQLLLQSLKLLTLVHIGGDLTLPAPSTSPILAELVRATMPENLHDVTPTPCFIRSRFGSVLPSLAQKLMNNILSSLELLLLNRECSDWPLALAVLLVVLMTVESIQYHAAKLAYHHSYDGKDGSSREEADHTVDDADIKTLLTFYWACFSGCHARLSPKWDDGISVGTNSVPLQQRSASLPSSLNVRPQDKFIESVRAAVKRATPEYLKEKAGSKRVGDDMAFFFDRLVAGVLVLGS